MSVTITVREGLSMQHRVVRKAAMTTEDAEAIGLKSLVFIAEDPARLARFLQATGLAPEDLRREAGTPPMLAALLSHLLADESMLLVFTTGAGLDPQEIHRAHAILGGASPWEST